MNQFQAGTLSAAQSEPGPVGSADFTGGKIVLPVEPRPRREYFHLQYGMIHLDGGIIDPQSEKV